MSKKAYTDSEQGNRLVNSPKRRHIDRLATDGTLRTNTGRVLSRTGVNNGINENLLFNFSCRDRAKMKVCWNGVHGLEWDFGRWGDEWSRMRVQRCGRPWASCHYCGPSSLGWGGIEVCLEPFQRHQNGITRTYRPVVQRWAFVPSWTASLRNGQRCEVRRLHDGLECNRSARCPWPRH